MGSSNFLISNKRGDSNKKRRGLFFIHFYRKWGQIGENLINRGVQIKCRGSNFLKNSNKRGVRLFGTWEYQNNGLTPHVDWLQHIWRQILAKSPKHWLGILGRKLSNVNWITLDDVNFLMFCHAQLANLRKLCYWSYLKCLNFCGLEFSRISRMPNFRTLHRT